LKPPFESNGFFLLENNIAETLMKRDPEGKVSEQGMGKIEPKILKGTRDFLPFEMARRNGVMRVIRDLFERFGYVEIETPILCPAETLLGKYAPEEEKRTYHFEDAGGRRIALPYDLTVPFARYVAAHFRNLPMPFKRYQIQRVWRAEKPQKGRLREFYQCDIDILGTRSLICEAEMAKIMVEVFRSLGLEDFKIRINSRRLINGILRAFGVAEDRFAEVTRQMDRLTEVGEEAVASAIETFGIAHGLSLLSLLKPEGSNRETLRKLQKHDTSEIEDFFSYCEGFSVPASYLDFVPTLVRGLDYYTGIVYEAVSPSANIGALCAGGRYDDLCSLFCEENFSGVGVSFGFERLMLVLEALSPRKETKLNSQVLVTLFDQDSVNDGLELYNDLIDAGMHSEIYFEPGNLSRQLKYADKKKIKFVILRGPEERRAGTVAVRAMKNGKQKTLPRNQLLSYFKGYYEGNEASDSDPEQREAARREPFFP
jgi:histidyl-tRNA synthetase